MRDQSSLFVVLHHRDDADQPWANEWMDDEIVTMISTTREIGRLCEAQRRSDDWVYVHRCGWGENGPRITCKVKVSSVMEVDRGLSLVKCESATLVGSIPSVHPSTGTNCYQGAPA
jgi:hypothetical protein